jgi:hypothetical protein
MKIVKYRLQRANLFIHSVIEGVKDHQILLILRYADRIWEIYIGIQ